MCICEDLLLFNLFLDYNLSETKHLKPKQKIDRLLLVVYNISGRKFNTKLRDNNYEIEYLITP